MPQVQNMAGVERALDRGEKALDRGDLEAAVQAYSEGIALDPSCSRLYACRAAVLLKLNRLQEALADSVTAKNPPNVLGSRASPRSLDLPSLQGAVESARAELDLAYYEVQRSIQVTFRVRLSAQLYMPTDKLYVIGSHPSLGGWVPSKGVPLSKREGLDWEGTLTLPVHPEGPVLYKYAIQVGGGSAWRWEDKVTTRSLPVEKLLAAADEEEGGGLVIIEDEEFNGGMRSGGLESAAETQTLIDKNNEIGGGQVTTVGGAEAGGECVVTFQIQVNTNFGEEVYVCGSAQPLGNWVPAIAAKLSTSKDLYPTWMGKVVLPTASETIKYKYIIKAGLDWRWEDKIPDRDLTPHSAAVLLNDGRFNIAQRQVTYKTLREGGAGAAVDAGQASSDVMAQTAAINAKNAALEAEVVELQKRRAIELQELEILRSKVQDGGAELALGVLDRVQSQLRTLEVSRAAVEERAKAVEEQLSGLRTHVREARESTGRLEAELELAQQGTASVQKTLISLQEKLRDIVDAAAMARKAVRAKHSEDELYGATLRQQLQETRERVSSVSTVVAELSSLHTAFNQSILSLRTQVTEADDESKRAALEKTEELAALEAMQKESRQELQREQHRLDGELDRTLRQAQAAAATLAELQAQDTVTAAALRSAQKEAQEWEAKLQDLSAQYAKVSVEEKESGALLAAKGLPEHEAIPVLQARAAELKEQVEQMPLRMAAESYKGSMALRVGEETQARIADVQRRVEAVVRDRAVVQSDVEKVQKECERLREERKGLQHQEDQLKEMELRRDLVREQYNASNAINEELRAALDRLKSELAASDALEAEVKEQLREAEEADDAAAAALRAAKERSVTLQVENAGNATRVMELRETADALMKRKVELGEDLGKVKDRMGHLEAIVARGEVPRDLTALEGMQNEIDQLEDEKVSMTEELQTKTELNEQLNVQITDGKEDQENMVKQMKLDMEAAGMELEALGRMNVKRDSIVASLTSQVILVREQVSSKTEEFHKWEHDKAVLDAERQEALDHAFKLAEGYEQGKEVLVQVREALRMEQEVRKNVQKDVARTQQKIVNEDRLLHDIKQKARHMEVMVAVAERERDQVTEELAHPKYKAAIENITTLQTALKIAQDTALHLSEDLQKAMKDNEEHERLFRTNREMLGKATNEAARLRRVGEAADREVENFAAQVKEAQETIKQTQTEAEGLEASLRGMEGKQVLLEAKTGYLESEATQLQAENEKLLQDKARLEERLAAENRQGSEAADHSTEPISFQHLAPAAAEQRATQVLAPDVSQPGKGHGLMDGWAQLRRKSALEGELQPDALEAAPQGEFLEISIPDFQI